MTSTWQDISCQGCWILGETTRQRAKMGRAKVANNEEGGVFSEHEQLRGGVTERGWGLKQVTAAGICSTVMTVKTRLTFKHGGGVLTQPRI